MSLNFKASVEEADLIGRETMYHSRELRDYIQIKSGSTAKTQVFPFIIIRVVHFGCYGAARKSLSQFNFWRNTARNHVAVANHISSA